MTDRPALPDGPALVVGLARSGVAAALALRSRGVEVIAADSREVTAEVRATLAGVGVERIHAPSTGTEGLDGAGWLVKSPGVPGRAPLVAAARSSRVPVLGEFELGWRLLDSHEIIAVTGSNGKTTTTELLGHLHRTAGVPVAVAGNVGTPLTALPGTLAPQTVLVCEASSFQLEDTLAFAPEAAVLLNLAEDHLDRHGTFVAYRAAKLEAFARQRADALAVLPAGEPLDDLPGRARRVWFGAAPHAAAEATVRDGQLVWRDERLLGVDELSLPGPHNVENALAAAAVALERGLPQAAVREGLRTFAGVPHRLELIATVAGVAYVNDSKATNVAAAEVALRSFEGGIHAILGGSDKGSDYAPLAAPVAQRCAAVYLIGETGPAIGAALAGAATPLVAAHTLDGAVAAAHAAARPGDTVLLAPACASYDQYRSYEERGEHFRRLVGALAG